MDTNKKIDILVRWLENKVSEAGAKGIVFGLSGGIDSAVMAGLAKKAYPETSLGVIMPCYSDEEDEKDAILVAKALDLNTSKVKLDEAFDSIVRNSQVGEENKLAKSNIKPRLRMTTLYYYAQSLGYLVAGPTNKSEFITGYYTKHGDSGVDILPLIDLTKKEIYELALELAIPKKIIDKVPSAGLWENQSDEDEMGFTYEELEDYINNEPLDEKIKSKIDKMYIGSGHKRSYPEKFIFEK